MKFTLATIVSSVVATDHSGHDHSALKPEGYFYGLMDHMSASGKNWNDMEMQLNFGKTTFDMLWWFGVKNDMVKGVPKQTFTCSAVPFSFDETDLIVSIDVDANTCLAAIKAKFDAGMIPDVVRMPVDHDTGDLIFPLAGGILNLNMYAVDGSINIPSGVDGLAPTSQRGRRSDEDVSTAQVPVVAVAEATTPKAAATLSGLISMIAIVALVL